MAAKVSSFVSLLSLSLSHGITYVCFFVVNKLCRFKKIFLKKERFAISDTDNWYDVYIDNVQ